MADLLDVLTPDEAYDAIGVSTLSVGHDMQLTRFVTAVSRHLDSVCGAVVQRQVTERYNGGGPSIELDNPAVSVTSVTEWQGATSWTLTSEVLGSPGSFDYYLDTSSQPPEIWRRSGGYGYVFRPGQGNVVVVYLAGRYPDTGSVDPLFKSAADLLLHDWWQASAEWFERHSSFSNDDAGMPPLPPLSARRVRDMLSGEIQSKLTLA